MSAAPVTRRSISLFGRAAQHEREPHIGGDRHVRVERVVLEHHGDVALLRRHLVHDALADADLARSDVFEPRDHPQQGRLAASRRADQDDELAVVDQDVDAMDDLDGSERLSDVADRDGSHAVPPGLSLGPVRMHLRVRPWASLPSAALRRGTGQHSLVVQLNGIMRAISIPRWSHIFPRGRGRPNGQAAGMGPTSAPACGAEVVGFR